MSTTQLTLSTERLLLHCWDIDALNALFENHTLAGQQEKIMECTGWSTERYEKHLTNYKEGFVNGKKPVVLFVLELKSTGEKIGNCGFHNWFKDHQRAELGYDIFADHHKRQGYMTEALRAIIEYGFTAMQLNRIEACTSEENIASQKSLAKFNFKKEGLMRSHHFKNEIFHDSLLFALLRNDYNSSK